MNLTHYNETVAIDVANRLSGRNNENASVLQIHMRNIIVESIRQYCCELMEHEEMEDTK